MATIRLYHNDRIRIFGDFENNNFIDVSGCKDEDAITVDLYPHFHYIEMRKKDNICKLFMFKKKGLKKHFDFGWWKDAEVVYSLNEVYQK